MANTGLALRLPHQNDVITTRISNRLELDRVYSSDNDTQKLNQLIDQIFEITQDSGRSPLKISGGIDFGNPKILKLLGAKEVLLYVFSSTMEKGTFLGFPEKYFIDFISDQARRVNK